MSKVSPMPVMNPMQRPLINPTICVGLTSFVVGTAIGIGIGVLIANNRYRNGGFGGGIWFGKRKRRSLDQAEEVALNAIAKYESMLDDDEE